jgi:hypothetical protein
MLEFGPCLLLPLLAIPVEEGDLRACQGCYYPVAITAHKP